MLVIHKWSKKDTNKQRNTRDVVEMGHTYAKSHFLKITLIIGHVTQ